MPKLYWVFRIDIFLVLIRQNTRRTTNHEEGLGGLTPHFIEFNVINKFSNILPIKT